LWPTSLAIIDTLLWLDLLCHGLFVVICSHKKNDGHCSKISI